MRLASLERDLWQLRPTDTPHPEAANLRRGKRARLIFDIQTIDEHGSPEVIGERMWVIVSEKIGDTYVGIVDSEPRLPLEEALHLRLGAEVPFQARHVIDVADLPHDYVDRQLGRTPERRWER